MQASLFELMLVAQHSNQQAPGGLRGLYEEFGWPFFVNMFVVIICFATIFERAFYLWSKFRVNSAELFNQIKKLVQAGNIDRAVKLCEAADEPILQVFRAGLTQVNRGEDVVATSIDEQLMEIEPKIKKRIDWLWSLANIGTLFGLLGTILGLIRTFKALDRIQDPGLRQQALARGIAEAMYNTALGLGIALLCMTFHLILNNKAKNLLSDIEQTTNKLSNLLTVGRGQG